MYIIFLVYSLFLATALAHGGPFPNHWSRYRTGINKFNSTHPHTHTHAVSGHGPRASDPPHSMKDASHKGPWNGNWSSYGWFTRIPSGSVKTSKIATSPSHHSSSSTAKASIKRRREIGEVVVSGTAGISNIPNGAMETCGTGCAATSSSTFVLGVPATDVAQTTATTTEPPSMQAGASARATAGSEAETSEDEPEEQASDTDDTKRLAVMESTHTSKHPHTSSTHTAAPEADEDSITDAEQNMSDADGSLGQAYRDLITCDSRECRELKAKIADLRGEIISIGKAVVTATTGWDVQDGAPPNSTGSLPSMWPVTTATTTTPLVGAVEIPGTQPISQLIAHESSMPSLATTAMHTSEQDTIMTKSSSTSVGTTSTNAPRGTRTHAKTITKHHTGTNSGGSSTISPMDAGSSTATWYGIEGSSKRPDFVPWSSTLVSPVVGEISMTNSGHAMSTDEDHGFPAYQTGRYAKSTDENDGFPIHPTAGVPDMTTFETMNSLLLWSKNLTDPSLAYQTAQATLNAMDAEYRPIVSNIIKLIEHLPAHVYNTSAASQGDASSTVLVSGVPADETLSVTYTPEVVESKTAPIGHTDLTTTIDSLRPVAISPVPTASPPDKFAKRDERMAGRLVPKDSFNVHRRDIGGLKRKRTITYEEAHRQMRTRILKHSTLL